MNLILSIDIAIPLTKLGCWMQSKGSRIIQYASFHSLTLACVHNYFASSHVVTFSIAMFFPLATLVSYLQSCLILWMCILSSYDWEFLHTIWLLTCSSINKFAPQLLTCSTQCLFTTTHVYISFCSSLLLRYVASFYLLFLIAKL
jgi:hypothetical protein